MAEPHRIDFRVEERRRALLDKFNELFKEWEDLNATERVLFKEMPARERPSEPIPALGPGIFKHMPRELVEMEALPPEKPRRRSYNPRLSPSQVERATQLCLQSIDDAPDHALKTKQLAEIIAARKVIRPMTEAGYSGFIQRILEPHVATGRLTKHKKEGFGGGYTFRTGDTTATDNTEIPSALADIEVLPEEAGQSYTGRLRQFVRNYAVAANRPVSPREVTAAAEATKQFAITHGAERLSNVVARIMRTEKDFKKQGRGRRDLKYSVRRPSLTFRRRVPTKTVAP